jgi:hypothetical protein
MSNSQNSGRPAATARSPRTWNFVETTFVALIAYAVFALTGGLGSYVIFLMLQDGAQKLGPAQFQELLAQWRWHGVALIIACPPTLAVLWVAIRIARREFAEYLALNWPTPKDMLLAFAVAAGLIVAQMVLMPPSRQSIRLLLLAEPPACSSFWWAVAWPGRSWRNLSSAASCFAGGQNPSLARSEPSC